MSKTQVKTLDPLLMKRCLLLIAGFLIRKCWIIHWNSFNFKEQMKLQLVIQGSHMVSGTRCPAGSDPVMKWSESKAAAPKGRCPVKHRGGISRRPEGDNSPLCPTGHRPFGAAALLSLHYFT